MHGSTVAQLVAREGLPDIQKRDPSHPSPLQVWLPGCSLQHGAFQPATDPVPLLQRERSEWLVPEAESPDGQWHGPAADHTLLISVIWSDKDIYLGLVTQKSKLAFFGSKYANLFIVCYCQKQTIDVFVLVCMCLICVSLANRKWR